MFKCGIYSLRLFDIHCHDADRFTRTPQKLTGNKFRNFFGFYLIDATVENTIRNSLEF